MDEPATDDKAHLVQRITLSRTVSAAIDIEPDRILTKDEVAGYLMAKGDGWIEANGDIDHGPWEVVKSDPQFARVRGPDRVKPRKKSSAPAT